MPAHGRNVMKHLISWKSSEERKPLIIKGAYQMNGQNRNDVKIGARVNIVLKADQRTGKRTTGIVAKLLTKSPSHPHGIKVMLEDGQVGRVQEILE